MTIDLSTARVGSEVTTHAGANLVISEIYPADQECRLLFKRYYGAYLYLRNGHRAAHISPDPMDIIAISPPSMSDAERLVEIVKICRREKERAIGAGVQCLVVEILDVAEGRSP